MACRFKSYTLRQWLGIPSFAINPSHTILKGGTMGICIFIKKSGGRKSFSAVAFMKQFLENRFDGNRDKNKLFGFLEKAPRDRYKLCLKLIDEWNKKGYNFEKPEHVVWSNLTMWSKHYGKEVVNYTLPAEKIGLYDPNYETWTPAPGSIVIWDEGQLQADGRDSQEMHPRVKAISFLHRKWQIDLLIFTQLDRIDQTFRKNATIVEIDEDIRDTKDKFGFITSSTINFKVFDSYKSYDAYNSNLKSKYYKTTSYTEQGCMFEHYDSYEGAEYFAECAARNGGLSMVKATKLKNTREAIKKWVETNPYSSPKEYTRGGKK